MSRDTGAGADAVVSFWREAGRDRWFSKDAAFDALCRDRFLGLYQEARQGRLSSWENGAVGALALLILLDQLPRNMFRGTPDAWRTDPMARAVAERAIDRQFDMHVDAAMRELFYLPLMHAEDLAAQDRSVRVYAALGNGDALAYAHHHRDIVARFGRFPHRNAALGRETTPEELAFLERDDFRG